MLRSVIEKSNDPVEIEQRLSPERLQTYRIASRGKLDVALELYKWNIALSGALFESSAIVEVVVRNEIDGKLTLWARKFSQDWLDDLPLDQKGKSDILKARSRGTSGSPHGKVIAELNFGFWRFLVANRYLHNLWIPILQECFPHLDGQVGIRREIVEHYLQKLWFLRNRIGHHEPIFDRNIREDLSAIDSLLGWISPDVRNWTLGQRRVESILLARPI